MVTCILTQSLFSVRRNKKYLWKRFLPGNQITRSLLKHANLVRFEFRLRIFVKRNHYVTYLDTKQKHTQTCPNTNHKVKAVQTWALSWAGTGCPNNDSYSFLVSDFILKSNIRGRDSRTESRIVRSIFRLNRCGMWRISRKNNLWQVKWHTFLH